MSSPIYRFTELALVSGPLDLPDNAVSFDDNWEAIIYTPDEIAKAILSVPSYTHLLHGADPDWAAWHVQWRCNQNTIDFDIFECEKCWGGSGFRTNCTLEEIIFVWTSIQETCPAVWLHDTDCRMYNPHSFVTDLPNKINEWTK